MANKTIPIVDEWTPEIKDTLFTQAKNVIVAPLHNYFHLTDNNTKINYF